MLDRQEVVRGVAECIASALDLEAENIKEENKIIDDLGADSLDLLDLTFRLERRFGIRISPRNIERWTQEKLGDTPIEIDGAYTPEALAELRNAMPEVPPEELADGLHQSRLPTRFRVATMVNLVHRLMDEQKDLAAKGGVNV